MSVLRPDLMMKCVIPVIMAGIIAVCPQHYKHRYDSLPLFIRSTGSLSRCSSLAIVSRSLRRFLLMSHKCAVQTEMTLFQGFVQLGAGLSVGLAGLAAGFAIGIVGDAGVRGTAQQPRLFVGMVSLTVTMYALTARMTS